MTTANLLADASQEMNKGDPIEFVMTQSICRKNQFGSDVDMVPNADTLNVKACAPKKATVECGKEEGPLKKLGINLKTEFMDKGCEMVIRK